MRFTATRVGGVSPAQFTDPRLALATMQRRAHRGLLEAGALVEAVARAHAPVGATQELRSRHGLRETADASGWPVVLVVCTAAHAKVIHDGRTENRKMPPPGVLPNWMRFKNIVETRPPKVAGRYGEVEYLIARKIGRKGFKGRPWLKAAAESSKAQIDAIMARALGGG